jgi:hypothetical protein
MTNNKIWSGNPNNLSKINGSGIFQEIPNGIWEPYSTMMGTFLGKQGDSFEFPHKIYGIEHDFIQHVIRTYDSSDKNVGVLMNGLKGAGKTVTAKTLANMCGLPIILVNAGNIEILNYFDDVQQPLCFFFDEFEKIMNHEDAKAVAPLLSFVDGTSSSNKHLMLFTSNESKISPYFLDRPGRIRYIKQYGSLKPETIKEIIDDMLLYPEFRKDIIEWVVYFKILTIDMLVSIIKEVNIHNMSPKVFGSFFNVNNEKPSYSMKTTVTHMVTGRRWVIENYRTYSDTTVPQLLNDLDDHDRNFVVQGKMKITDENGKVSISDYNKELYFYVDMLTDTDMYYEEGKTKFMFCGSHFEGKISSNMVFFPDDDQDRFDNESGWSVLDFNHLVLEFDFIAKNNYTNFQF